MILINMEIPKNCKECRLKYIDELGTATCMPDSEEMSITDVTLNMRFDERPVWCPLTEVEPYGAVLYKEKIKQPIVDENQMTWEEYDDRD